MLLEIFFCNFIWGLVLFNSITRSLASARELFVFQMETMSSAEFRTKHAAPKKKRKFKQVESGIQKACVEWFRYRYKRYSMLLFSIPNGASSGNKVQRIIAGKKMKAEGALAGAADLFLAVPSGDCPGLFIELKTKKKGSKQQDNQRAFEKAVIDKGYGYAIPRSRIEFEKIVTSYLEKGEY